MKDGLEEQLNFKQEKVVKVSLNPENVDMSPSLQIKLHLITET